MAAPHLDLTKRIAFIGGGNMAKAIIGGLFAVGFPAANIAVSEPFPPAIEALKTAYPASFITSDNNAAITFGGAAQPADLILFAVKPQVIKSVAEGVSVAVQKHKPVVITIAAGIRVADLARWLSADPVTHAPLPGASAPAIVRVMPNTPALVSEGASGLWADASLDGAKKDLAFSVVNAFSQRAYWVEKEGLLDVVTGVSGSGPAYFFYLLEALEEAAVQLGMPRDIARGLAAQTCVGAGKMALSMEDPTILRRNVTSPNGTTHAGIQVFEAAGAKKVMIDVVKAATRRAEELAEVMGSQL
ncbi:pyrroline-5-carboxylate reductase dimerization-domain-containing protein [Zopfochytrium polystomum]|nr:pyrroline-5-carboxylate reductase dimerization-domain-containing protein [Zopfochytrium polystomum]